MDSSLRRVRNTQRSNIAFKDGTPSKTTLTEGEELMAIRKNKGLSLFRRQKGILWWMNFTRDGNEIIEKNLKVIGNAEISRDLTVNGNIKGTRGFFDGGESGEFTATRYLDFNNGTQMGSTIGYRMHRAGSITGLSCQFNVTQRQYTPEGLYSKVELYVRKNGTSVFGTTALEGQGNTYSTGNKGSSSIQARGADIFVVGDVLTLYVLITNYSTSSVSSVECDDFNAFMEVTYDT